MQWARILAPLFLITCVALAGVPAAPQGLALAAQSSFPHGTPVALQGTPHLWIADEAGLLHWGGDTRALQGRLVEWGSRVEVSLQTLKTLRRGDPYLTAGLLKDGEPIYLVKWETTEAAPRLLHIQCISDVELFGINERNYGTFVIDRNDWERRFNIPVSTLQKAELESADPSAGACGRPKLTLTTADLARLAPALQMYGLSPSDVNAEKTVTLGLPDSVVDPGADAIALMSAPMVRPPTQTEAELRTNTRGVPIGVIKLGRQAEMSSGDTLAPNVYLVVVRGGSNQAMVYVPGGTSPRPITTSMIPDIRRMSRDVARPQTLMVPDGICWSWSRTQVCGEPSPVFDVMTDSEQNRMSSVMNSSVRRLSQAGRLRGVDINLDATMPDLEGASAVAARRGSMLAAPVYAPDPATLTGAPRPASADVDVLVGALYVERDVEIPDYTTVPRGDYAIHARRTSGVWRAELVAADGRRLDLAAQNVEVLGGATEPIVAILNLAIIVPPSSPPISICLFREECE